jgi:hypothetical protein
MTALIRESGKSQPIGELVLMQRNRGISQMYDRTVIGVLAINLALVGSTSAQQDTESANYLMPKCEAPFSPDYFTGVCDGIINAILALGKTARSVCPPATATRAQATLVAVQYIKARPQRMHESYTLLSMEALHGAWPCK